MNNANTLRPVLWDLADASYEPLPPAPVEPPAPPRKRAPRAPRSTELRPWKSVDWSAE